MIDRYYTPQALADATGLCVSQCRALILQSPERLLVSRNTNSKKKRWAISEHAFCALVDAHRAKAAEDQRERNAKQRPVKTKSAPRKARNLTPGLNPDGTIMNSRQLKEAGMWKGA